MEFSFKNKTVLVTGGARSIGLGIVKMYLKYGAKVITTYNNSFNFAEELVEYAYRKKYDLKVFKLDLNNIDEIYRFLQLLRDENVTKIDILVNNSGVCYIDPLIFQDDCKILSMININLTNTLILTKHILKDFMENNSTIINISSIWGNVGASCEVIYSVTKGGINLFTKAIAKEMEDRKIKVIAIAPGIINTKINEHLSDVELKEIIEEIPLKRIGTVEDVVNAVDFFSRDCVNITGEIIYVDGGWIG